MLAVCRPKCLEGNGRSGHSIDFDDPTLERYAQPGAPSVAAPSNGGASTSDPYRTRSNFDDVPNGQLVATQAVQQSNGGVLGRCRPCTNVCRDRAGSGEDIYGAVERYPAQQDEEVEEGYHLLDETPEEEQDAETFVRELAEMKGTVKGLWKVIAIMILLVAIQAGGLAFFGYAGLEPEMRVKARRWSLLASIPIVALLFTWFHIWLAIQMMFLPIKFLGIWQHKGSGMGIGWQGIVPRKAHKMAQTAYVSGRPYLDGPKDWLTRVDAPSMVAQIRPQLKTIVLDSLNKVMNKNLPTTSSLLSDNAKDKIAQQAVDEIQATSQTLWDQWVVFMCDPVIGVDNDGLIVKVFTENKKLLNDFFQKLGAREFRFIEHCGAGCGFFCGLMQLVAFQNLSPMGRAIFLPCSGFFLGILSNWMAITCVFKPCHPIPVKICGWHVCDIQGLFLKRQPEVAVLYSKLLCEHFLCFPKVVNYLQTKPVLWAKLRDSYIAHNAKVMKDTLGVSVQFLAPLALGQDQFVKVEEELKLAMVNGLRKATEIHRVGGKYIGKVTNIEQNNTKALKSMPPDQFEDLLHPIFKEDEWILILLGGVLGAIVGFGQIFLLSN